MPATGDVAEVLFDREPGEAPECGCQECFNFFCYCRPGRRKVSEPMGRWNNDEFHELDRCERLLDRIRSEPGIDGKALCRATNSLGSQVRRYLIECLIRDGEISVTVDRTTSGRPRKRYWPVNKDCPDKYVFSGHIPTEEQRRNLLHGIGLSDSDRIDWDAIRRIHEQAWR